MLIGLIRPDVLLSILLTFNLKLVRRGLPACLPSTLLILTDCFLLFLVKGLFFPSGPFSFIDVRSFFAACVVYSFFWERLISDTPCILTVEISKFPKHETQKA